MQTRQGDFDATEIEQLLQTSAEEHAIVGASLAVAGDEQLVETAYGVINANTGVEVTTDAVFQIAPSPNCSPPPS